MNVTVDRSGAASGASPSAAGGRRRAGPRRSRLLTACLPAACALLGAAAFAPTAGAGARPAGQYPVGTATWTRIDGGTDNATQVGIQLGLARTPDGILHVIWNRGYTPTTIFQTLISPKGSLLKTTTVASNWDGNGGLALLVMPNHTLRLFVSGGYKPGLGAHFVGVNTFTAPESGASWSYDPGLVWGGVFAGSEIAATLGPGGQVVTAFSDSYHVGLGPHGPTPAVHPDMFNPQLATDQATGAVIYGGVTIAGKGGTFAQRLLPSPGPALMLGSATENASAGLAARIGGGVYIVTANGSSQTLALTRYGGSTVKVAVGGGYTRANVFAAPDGRLWVAWFDFRGSAMYVTRSNNAVTKFEPVQTLLLPAVAVGTVSGIQGEGSLGPLDLFADMQSGNETGFLYTHVLAVMTATTAVTTVTKKIPITGKKGKVLGFKLKVVGFELKVTVTDAGDPLAGASVTANAKHATTGKFGVASFSFGAASAGPVDVTVTDPGYHLLTTSARL